MNAFNFDTEWKMSHIASEILILQCDLVFDLFYNTLLFHELRHNTKHCRVELQNHANESMH